jgi:flagellin-like protein
MKYGKRGLSAIVATVLIILITIAAVGIIAGFIVPFVRDSLDDTSCFQYRDYYSFDDEFDYNCYNDNGGDFSYLLTVKARADTEGSEKVEGFSFRFVGDSSAQAIQVLKGDPVTNIDIVGGFGGGNIVIPEPDGTYSVLTYDHTTAVEYNRIEIYPIIEGGEICERNDNVKLVECA